MAVLLGVNVDHVATLRQARGGKEPDPLHAALEAELGGADGITIHLREDHRHIQPRDVQIIKECIQTRLNLEMAATDEMILFAKKIAPAFCCLVPEHREELTTEGGLNVLKEQEKIYKACNRLIESGILVSLFIDPDLHQIDAAMTCGAKFIEIHTGEYANAKTFAQQQEELQRIVKATEHANEIGLTVNAGHGLNYRNVNAIAAIKGMHELNIGHSIISRAVYVGIQLAVQEMKRLVNFLDK